MYIYLHRVVLLSVSGEIFAYIVMDFEAIYRLKINGVSSC